MSLLTNYFFYFQMRTNVNQGMFAMKMQHAGIQLDLSTAYALKDLKEMECLIVQVSSQHFTFYCFHFIIIFSVY